MGRWVYKGDLRGPRGHSVEEASITQDGRLRLLLTSGEVVDAGRVKGENGLPGVNAIPAANAVASYLSTSGSPALNALLDQLDNQETELATAIISLTGSSLPSWVPFPFYGATITSPRPAEAVGRVCIWYVVSDDPSPTPLHVGPNDIVVPLTAVALPWNPLQDSDIQIWLDPQVTGVGDGATVTPWPDRTGNHFDAVEWGLASGQATSHPVRDADGLGGTPSVVLPTRAGLTKNITLQPTAALLYGINAQFSAATTVMTACTFSASGFGKYSLGKASGGATWFVTTDTGTTFNFGVADSNPHSFLVLATVDYIRVWVDGALALSQAIALPVQSISAFRLGYVSGGADNGSWRLMSNGRIGDFFVSFPAAVPDDAAILLRNTFLMDRRNA